MKIIKVVTLLFISFSLTFGNFANAAMLCCAIKSELATEIKMVNEAEMPCHQTAETGKKMQHDKSCGNCKNCVSMSGIILIQPLHKLTFTDMAHHFLIISFNTGLPADIYSPPKQIS